MVNTAVPTKMAEYHADDVSVVMYDYGDHWEVVTKDGAHTTAVVRNERHGARYLFAETVAKAQGYKGVR